MHFMLYILLIQPHGTCSLCYSRLSRQKVDTVLEERADLILVELPVLEIYVYEIRQAVF